jgi:pimeloyl-ACP methyl ester carboxylesterase
MADDLEAIADALGLARFHLVAHAFGAFSAFDVALSTPERIRTLVVSQSQAALGAPQYEDVRRRLVRVQPGMAVEERELGGSYRARDPGGVERWKAMEARNHPEPSGRQGQRRHLSLEDLERVTVPTLFIAGEEDLYAPPEMVAMMVERVPGAESVVLKAGHSGYWERPGEWNQAVLYFIAAHSG